MMKGFFRNKAKRENKILEKLGNNRNIETGKAPKTQVLPFSCQTSLLVSQQAQELKIYITQVL